MNRRKIIEMNATDSKTREVVTPEASLDARIVSTPGTCGGKPRIAGSRITVKHLVLDHQRGGMSPDEIASAYSGLSLGDVYAALAYYFYNRDDIDADIKADDEQWAEIERQNPDSLGDRLNQRKIDVTTTPEVGLRGVSDEAQAAFCLAEVRVIFTQDTDFLRIHSSNTPHAGIAFCQQRKRTIGQIIAGLVLIWERMEPAEVYQWLVYL